MSIFQIDPSSPINDLSSIRYRLNLQDTLPSRQTEFGSIDPADYIITRYNNLVNFPKVNNKTKNIRLTLTPNAIRSNKFDIYSGNFDSGYPLNSNKTFCGDKLSTVFNTGNEYWTKSFSTKYSYPVVGNLDIVSSNQLITCNGDNGDDGDNCVETPCNSGFTFDNTQCSCVSCASIQCLPGQIFDPVSCLCVSPPTCIGQGECLPVTIPEIKTTIYGYAFYLDVVRTVNIPNITTPVQVSCAGGHSCCRTLFRPKIVKSDQTEILADRNISMDNSEYMGCSNDTQIPVPGFTPLSPGERSDTFTITLNNSSDITDAALYLDCQYSSCHNGVTFIVLVAELASSTDKIVIFSSCVSPGSINRKPIGTIDCAGEEGLCNGDIAYSCYDGVCRNVVDMGGIFGQGLWLNDPFCGGQCDPVLSPYCYSFSIPPSTIEKNGNTINITENIVGDVEVYPLGSQTSCGDVIAPPNSKWLGKLGSFSYTLNFSSLINNIIILINSTGHTYDENFIITTNGGTPSIIEQTSCYTTIVGNQIFSGQGTTPGMGGGGGIFLISAPSEFTSLTISGNGGQNGSLFAICSNSTPTTPTPTPPPCADNEGCCLSNYCAMGSGVYNTTLDLMSVYGGCGSTNYTCCNGLYVEITSSTEAGFNSSISGNPLYDATITVS